MSLDTYLPAGGGRYVVGSVQSDAANFYCFMPESPDHVRIGLKVTDRGEYIDSEYTDVIVNSPDVEFKPLESGEYHIIKKGRYQHYVEFSSEGSKKRFNVYAQPRLGRFRLLSDV
jgi:hypothetical protein